MYFWLIYIDRRSQPLFSLIKGRFNSFSDYYLWEGLVTLKRTRMLLKGASYDRSPQIHLASWISFGMIVMCLAWMAHKLVSSNKLTRYASAASCSARIAPLAKFSLPFMSWAISHTRFWKGSLLISNSVDFWNWQISRRATVPGLYRCGFLGAADCTTPLFHGGLARPGNGLCTFSHAVSEGTGTFRFSPSWSWLTVR